MRIAVATAALAAIASGLGAQTRQTPHQFEFQPYVGGFIPTGDLRDLLKNAVFVGGQASYVVLPALAITANFGWSPSKDRITAGNQSLDVYQYDIGVDVRAPAWLKSDSWEFTPSVGLGLGGRTYSYRDLQVDSQSNFDGYGSLAGALGLGAVAIRLEARDYISGFKPLTGRGESATRNDVSLSAGLVVRF